MKANPKQPNKPEAPAVDLDAIELGAVEMAEFLLITPRRLQQMAADGTVPAPKKRGRYKFKETLLAYVRFQQRIAAGEGATKDFQDERLRGIRLQNDDRETSLAERTHALAPITIAGQLLEALVGISRAKIINGFRKFERQVKRNSDPAKLLKLSNECRDEILSELSVTDAANFTSQLKAEAVRAARKLDRNGMGGQVPQAE